jgi:hypothetical protein
MPRAVRLTARAVGAVGALAIAIAGCGAAASAPRAPAASSTRTGGLAVGVTSTSCSVSGGGAGSRTVSSCMFVLSDGRRFMCPETFGVGRSPVSVGTLEHAKACRRLSTLPVPSAFRVVFAAIAKVRTCLTTAGHHVSGGPVFPPDPHAPDQPDGELITFDGTAQIFIAFYLDSLKARRLEPMVIHNVHGLGGEVERRKGVTVLWTRRPTPAQRTSLERCAFG